MPLGTQGISDLFEGASELGQGSSFRDLAGLSSDSTACYCGLVGLNSTNHRILYECPARDSISFVCFPSDFPFRCQTCFTKIIFPRLPVACICQRLHAEPVVTKLLLL